MSNINDDFFYDHFWWIVGAASLFLVALLIWSIRSDGELKAKFMAECRRYEREYQCVAKWRAGDSRTAVVPAPIIIR